MNEPGTPLPRETVIKQISVIELIKKIILVISDILKKWKLLLTFTCLGALGGVVLSLVTMPKYTAVCTFVLDENDKSSVLGEYAGLASLAGLDVGGGGGIFKGDNILELYRSRLMLKKTLLTDVAIGNTRQRLIDRYVNSKKLTLKWKKDPETGDVNFIGPPEKFNRKQDSLITDIIETINKDNLEVGKPDKKLGVIRVAFTFKDEIFAKLFTDNLVNNVNDYYVQTKTKRSALNVAILQRQSDSVRIALNSALTGVASSMDAAPNANPARLMLRLPSQKKQIDVQAGNVIYSEMIKNLELAKITLRQQTPLIQFMDQPEYPLKISHIGKIKGLIIGALLGLIAILLALLAKRFFYKLYVILS
ncbi:lipopolysaccharide biosynthesis protein [Mucilaginibacter corticis]|uniref:Lipopolysaccharide biosynthesis protein n=1 Tax=Mucilaginibacter corticis TaxID=2597670 RepID=A0A556M925_9SPHI|nr:lipopolysaccharide biosynthesis protein [Mucilaginibacter corticis]TSJ36393.1 lipopolysaccharide biosynthesis protein [Mucilaginibacter corticis]